MKLERVNLSSDKNQVGRKKKKQQKQFDNSKFWFAKSSNWKFGKRCCEFWESCGGKENY